MCEMLFFFVMFKIYNGSFQEIFYGAEIFLIPIVKKVSAPSQNIAKWPMICIAHEKNYLLHFKNQRYSKS